VVRLEVVGTVRVLPEEGGVSPQPSAMSFER
jgi:hypothetical protein